MVFLLTRLLRGATKKRNKFCGIKRFLLTRPMRGATFSVKIMLTIFHISTHTPHAGRDLLGKPGWRAPREFLLTRPMRGATCSLGSNMDMMVFLLTRPMRGATIVTSAPFCGAGFLLTRPMRGATTLPTLSSGWIQDFYSHAPCGARRQRRGTFPLLMEFLLTRPMRGATLTIIGHFLRI